MSFTEEKQEEIRELCFRWIAKHDDVKTLRLYGGSPPAVEALIALSRDLRDAVTEAGI